MENVQQAAGSCSLVHQDRAFHKFTKIEHYATVVLYGRESLMALNVYSRCFKSCKLAASHIQYTLTSVLPRYVYESSKALSPGLWKAIPGAKDVAFMLVCSSQ